MELLDWILVAFGVVVALAGGWIQLHPERIYPSPTEGWQLEPKALSQIRLLGACFHFMGAFFAVQMTVDLTHLPWWTGTLGGLATAVIAVSLVRVVARRQQRRRHLPIQQSLPEKALEIR